MSARRNESYWLEELGAEDAEAGPSHDADLAAALLLADLEPVALDPSRRERLLEATGKGRLARFAETLARLVDVSVEHAKTMLDRAMEAVGWEEQLIPGVTTLWVEGGPAVAGCIRGFVRMEAGAEFPMHLHLGDEIGLILEGVAEDSNGDVYGPGDIARRAAGTEHSYRARAGGPDLLLFSIVREAIAIGDIVVRHRD